MIIKRQYLDYEKSNGFIMTKVLNPSYANDTIPFDVFEAVHNPGESGALFIPTRVMVTRNQGQKGSCENPGYPCDSDEDCDTGDDMSTGKCSNSMCVRRGWCPSETVRTPGTEVYKDDAIILVSALFDCDLSKDSCETTIESVAVDTATGFNFKHANYYEEGGERKRDSYWFYGIRLVIFSTGIGQRPSIAQVVLQISQAIALLSCAGAVADFFLQAVVPERKHYIAEKIIETEDFGD